MRDNGTLGDDDLLHSLLRGFVFRIHLHKRLEILHRKPKQTCLSEVKPFGDWGGGGGYEHCFISLALWQMAQQPWRFSPLEKSMD